MWYDDTFAVDDSLRHVADGHAANLFCFREKPGDCRKPTTRNKVEKNHLKLD